MLLHLNGPPAVGKSTIARALAADRPLALELDIDSLRVRLGRWADRPESKQVARQLGFALASAHLRDGHDVVLPQLVLRPEVVDHLADLAAQEGAGFVEVVLVAQPAELVGRLQRRRGAEPHPRDLFSQEDLEEQVHRALDALPALAGGRPGCHVVDVTGLPVEQAAAAVRDTAGW